MVCVKTSHECFKTDGLKTGWNSALFPNWTFSNAIMGWIRKIYLFRCVVRWIKKHHSVYKAKDKQSCSINLPAIFSYISSYAASKLHHKHLLTKQWFSDHIIEQHGNAVFPITVTFITDLNVIKKQTYFTFYFFYYKTKSVPEYVAQTIKIRGLVKKKSSSALS